MNAFDRIDFRTPQGQDIREMLERWLQQKREQNDSCDMTAADSLVLRGEIRLIKRLLQEPAPVVKATPYNSDIHYAGGDKQ